MCARAASASLRVARRRLTTRTDRHRCASPVAAFAACFSPSSLHRVRIGMGMRTRPGVSTVGRIDFGPILARQPAARHHERRCRADRGSAAIVSPAARRCASSTIARARRCRRSAGRPSNQAGPSGVPCPTSSRSGRCGAGWLRSPPITTLAAGEGLATALRIDDDGAVRTPVGLAARRVGVVGTRLAVGGVAIDHRIHVAGGDAEEQVRLAEPGKPAADSQSGWLMMPTRKPCASSSARPAPCRSSGGRYRRRR
jgi:hypothetical protein